MHSVRDRSLVAIQLFLLFDILISRCIVLRYHVQHTERDTVIPNMRLFN